jgi:hypothetical protein
VGLDPAVALAVPRWFSAQPPVGVDARAIRPPIYGYRALVEQHVRRELRFMQQRAGSVSNQTREGQLKLAFDSDSRDPVLKSAHYAMSRGAMLEAWARSFLFYLSDQGSSSEAANALLSDIAELAAASSSKDLQQLSRSTLTAFVRDGKGHDGIVAVLGYLDRLLLSPDNDRSARAFRQITWEVGTSALELLHRLTHLGRVLRYDDAAILSAWKDRVRAARDDIEPDAVVRKPYDQQVVDYVYDRFASLTGLRPTAVTNLEFHLRDSPLALSKLAKRRKEELNVFSDDYDCYDDDE